MIKITPAQLRIVKDILAQHAPDVEVRAFGSRVEGTPKDYSDLDLVVLAQKKLGLASLDEMREAFSQSDLPFRVEVSDWNSISDDFKKIIQEKYEVVQRAGSKPRNIH
jgi:predicted nucleotidyltransferase